jgi:multidrug efflux system membrane fusion protein
MFVYVVGADDTVRPVAVSVAQTLDGRALIDSALAAGDTVVTAGQYRLSNGVKIAPAKPNDPHVQNSTEASAGML